MTPTRRPALRLVRGYAWALPVITVLSVAASVLEGFGISLFIPLLQGPLLQGAPDPGGTAQGLGGVLAGMVSAIPPEHRLPALTGAIFGSILLKCALAYANAALIAVLAGRIGHRLRVDGFRQMTAVSPAWLRTRRNGEVFDTLSGEVWKTVDALVLFAGLVGSVCTVAVFAMLLLLISWTLTAVVAVALAVMAVAFHALARKAQHLGERAVAANRDLDAALWEGYGALGVIRAFGREADEVDRFRARSDSVRRVFIGMEVLSAASGPLFEASAALLILVIFAAMGLHDPARLPTLAAFLLVLFRMQPQIRQVVSHWISLRLMAGAVSTVARFLDPSDKHYLRSGDRVAPVPAGAIRFDKVAFRYGDGTPPALDGVSFDIPRGRTTALVGPSGAGKSTVVALITRSFDPTAGAVLADGIPLPDLDLRDWRGRIGLVSQDVFLFDASVHDNIAYGRPGAGAEEVVEAARVAHADGFIRALPDGYATRLAEGGGLSGGQRQRLALARAILRNPEILILDEATNALDSLSESLVEDALATFGRERTVIVVAHRLATVRRASHVVVLNQGRVAEQGTPAELIGSRGLFAALHEAQFGQGKDAAAMTHALDHGLTLPRLSQ